MAFSLLVLFLPLVIILFVVVYTAKNKGKDEELMIRHLYTYLVLFATLMMVIGGGISIFMAAADLVSPTSYYQSFEDYKRFNQEYQMKEDNKEVLTEEEMLANYEKIVQSEKNRTQENAQNQMIKSLGFIVIPLPIFLYFNNMRKKQKEE
ncbi:hypothetical protein JMM81_08390 [Bacillus sp. V3B]|uniref:hypothetical protein n=1 Tax=Bacillus sp. V3B TaxID=2804915 RepID=UPI00210B68F5|nr:hypothetical protein [Bacillus sp. V3B]MCQ6274978.1 hypothetical protein [Bacillus sp. V3B]